MRAVYVFRLLSMPSPVGKKWVEYNSGQWTIFDGTRIEFRLTRGWILSESEEELEILDDRMQTRKHKRDRTLPAAWDRLTEKPPGGTPLPGEYRQIDYAGFCRGLLDAGPPAGFDALEHAASGGMAFEAELALHAYWAFQCGWESEAIALVEFAKSRLEKGTRLESFLAENIASTLRQRALLDANAGVPREALLKQWKAIRSLPTHPYSDTASKMIERYGQLVEEDHAWKEPSPDERARMDPALKAAYWLHRLRDRAAPPTGNPGPCDLLGDWSGQGGGESNPATELVALGWAALPLLIEHLDDERPTRSLQWWRAHAPKSWHLLRYGDCCAFLFTLITGVELPHEGYMLQNTKLAEAKAEAVKWWSEALPRGEEEYWTGLLPLKEKAGAWRAARGLLRIDRARFVPRLLEAIRDPLGEMRPATLRILGSHLEESQRPAVEGFLRDGDPLMVLEAARALWSRFRSEEALRALLTRVESFNDDRDGKYFAFDSQALAYLAELDLPMIIDAVCRFVKSGKAGIRPTAIYCARSFRHPAMAEALVSLLEEKETISDRFRTCDRAAESLAALLGVPEMFNDEAPLEARDSAIRRLEAWWAANRKSLDRAKIGSRR